MREFCQNVVPVMQPKPSRHPGGDCFACALTAALRHQFPDADVAFNSCWDCFVHSFEDSGELLVNSWPYFARAFGKAQMLVGRLEIATDIVVPEFDLRHSPHAWFQGIDHSLYVRRLEGYLRSGWSVFTSIDFSRRGPSLPDGTRNDTDHLILLDGVRGGWEALASGAKRWKWEVHVVCSVEGAYWVDVVDLLYKSGAAGWIMFRPSF